MNRHVEAALFLMILALAGVIGVAAAPKSATVNVTTTLADSQNGAGLLVGSDTQGAYVTTVVKKQEVISSAIRSYSDGTDWWLTTYGGVHQTPSNRSVFFSLTEPVSPTNPIPPFTTGYAQAHLIAKCRLVGVDMFRLTPGTSVDCPGAFRFQAEDGSWYRFSFQPENFPQVNRLRVTCLSSDSGGCKVWTIRPASALVTGTDPNPKSLNTLLLLDGAYSDTVVANFGDYYLSFAITVAR